MNMQADSMKSNGTGNFPLWSVIVQRKCLVDEDVFTSDSKKEEIIY